MDIQTILYAIKDMFPLTSEQIQTIRELPHDDKMTIILTFDEVVQYLTEFMYDSYKIEKESTS
jgi:hypothetical protein